MYLSLLPEPASFSCWTLTQKKQYHFYTTFPPPHRQKVIILPTQSQDGKMKDSQKFEKQFFDALNDIFVGAKVEGDSGYINLMHIKSRYYTQGVFPRLKEDIDKALQPFPGFREELFDKLYTFFQRYFSESGSIYFRYTPLHQKVYEQVYTDDRDVILFWKTHMLYYVKTDRIFNSLNVEVNGVKFFFDASSMQLKKSNEKRQVIFDFRQAAQDGTLVFDVTYSERGRVTKMDDILRAARQAGHGLDDDTLDQAMRVFEKQSEVDFFINKNARAFLQEQFELWLYQYLFAGKNVWDTNRLAQLQVLKDIAFKVIDFISQFEDELVKVWNKPKFVRNSHYIITVDHVVARSAATKQSPVEGSRPEPVEGPHPEPVEGPQSNLWQKLTAHPGMKPQLEEWQTLGMIDQKFNLGLVTEQDLTGAPAHPQYQHLPLDTRHFPDLKLDILALFDNLDAALDGWLVHSENYQALNTMLPKFQEQVKVIYIDPPYNTGGDDFIYTDKFRHSTWLTMIENRLQLARELLSKSEGSIFISIDDNENASLRQVSDLIFSGENFIASVIWQKVFSPKNTAKYFSDDHDYLLVYAKDKSNWSPYLLPRSSETDKRYTNPDNDPRGDWSSSDLTARNFYSLGTYEVVSPGGNTFKPAIGTYWRVSKENFARLDAEKRIWWGTDGNNMPRLKRYLSEVKSGIVPQTLWKHEDVGNTQEAKKELLSVASFEKNEDVLNTVKPTRLLQRVLDISTSSDFQSIVLDFFAGGGSTAHAVIKQNRMDNGHRKYILVEMGEHYKNIILPRIKKVVFSSKWKNGKPVFEKDEGGFSHFVKYYELEQYEDALRRARYADADLFDNPFDDPYHQYVFLRDIKMLDSLDVDSHQDQVHFHPERIYENIDLAETLSNLRGKWIKRITPDLVEFEDGETMSLTNPDWRVIKPLVWW